MRFISAFENVDEAKRNHMYRAKLWRAIHDWKKHTKAWENETFEDIEVSEISQISDKFTKTIIQCERNLPPESTAVQHLKKLVFAFRETMPIVEAFGNRNLQEVHWNEIKGLLEIEDFPLQDRQF